MRSAAGDYQGEDNERPADEVRRRDAEMVEGEPGERGAEDHGEAEDRFSVPHEPVPSRPASDWRLVAVRGLGMASPIPSARRPTIVEEDTVRDQVPRGEEVEGGQDKSAEDEPALREARLEACDQDPLRHDGTQSHESEEESIRSRPPPEPGLAEEWEVGHEARRGPG